MIDEKKAELAIALADEMMKFRRENRFRDAGDIGERMDDYYNHLTEVHLEEARDELITAALSFKEAEETFNPYFLSKPKAARKRLMEACDNHSLAEQAMEQ